MHPADVEAKLEACSRLFAQERHEDALATLDSIGHLLPNSPVLLRMRVEGMTALGRKTEAQHECEKLILRLDQIRDAGDLLDSLFDLDQAARLAEMVTEQSVKAGTLKAALQRS
ncbi:MAG: hypothetical protein GX580_11495, partial [Candidatus Hydrogenedens sp.]|nr:hypothetical protein [Candidatus Hydrogenedens sp.]